MARAATSTRVLAVLLLACGGEQVGRRDADAGQSLPAAGADGHAGAIAIPRDAAAEARDAAAGPADGGQPTSAPDAGADAGSAGPRRAFALASAGTQLLVEGPSRGLQLTAANLADDVDVMAVHQEFYGVPWQAFRDGEAPPAAWSARMEELERHAHGIGDRVFLSISMLDGTRETLAERTVVEDGQPRGEDGWAAGCYDFQSAPDGAEMRAAYLRYVEYMLALFEPTYLNYAIEVNLFLEKCPEAAAGLIEVANAAYDTAKRVQPAVIAFPSLQIDHLHGYADDSCPVGMDREACFDRNYEQIVGLKRDRFAVSSYPYLQGRRVEDLPEDWFERAAARGGERPLIAETGWLSTDLVAHDGLQCNTVIVADEADAAAYLRRVLSDAERIPLELVTWWSNRDLLPAELMTSCPCDYDPTWCQVVDVFKNAGGGPLVPGSAYFGEILLKAFGTMGLRDYRGEPKPALAGPWNDARALPLSP